MEIQRSDESKTLKVAASLRKTTTLTNSSQIEPRRNRGFTLLELLVALAVIVVLISLLLPAVQQAREAARRGQCRNNLTQIGIALNNYRMAHGVLPPGTQNDTGPIHSKEGGGYHMGWLTQILPYIEQQNAYHKIEFTMSVYDPVNSTVRGHFISTFACPSSRTGGTGPITCYFGVHNDIEAPIDVNQNGVLFLNSSIDEDQIPDGQSHTIFVMEGAPDWGTGLGWMSGSRSSLRNAVILQKIPAGLQISPGGLSSTATGDFRLEHHSSMKRTKDPGGLKKELDALEAGTEHVGGSGSHHDSGAHYLFGDGSVRFISSFIDTKTFRNLAHRADGELPSEF